MATVERVGRSSNQKIGMQDAAGQVITASRASVPAGEACLPGCAGFGCVSRLVAVLCVLCTSVCFAQSPAPAAAPKAEPDVLVFTNGDRLTGKLERATDGKVVFNSDMAGELTIPFDKIKELHSVNTFVALGPGQPSKNKVKPEGQGAVALTDGSVTLTPSTGEAQTVATKNLGYLIDVTSYDREVAHEPNLRKGWSGAATAGFSLVRSTESTTTFNGALNLVRQVPTVDYLPKRNRTTFNIVETYGTNTTPVIPPTVPFSPPVTVKTSIFHADAERDQYVNARLYYLGDVSFDHNFAQGLQFEQIYGVGLGWTPVQGSRQELDLKGEIHYERQQFIQTAGTPFQPELDLIGSTFQENYRRSLPKKISFTEWANILPAWNNLNAYSANAYVGFAMPVYKRLNVSLSATDNYLNNPAVYYRRNSVQFVTGVTYLFK